MVTVDGSRLAGPAMRDAQIALRWSIQDFAIILDQLRTHAEEWLAGAARLHVMGMGQGRYHDAAGFGLPPGVDDWRLPAADMVMVPAPGFGVYGFSYGAKNPER